MSIEEKEIIVDIPALQEKIVVKITKEMTVKDVIEQIIRYYREKDGTDISDQAVITKIAESLELIWLKQPKSQKLNE